MMFGVESPLIGIMGSEPGCLSLRFCFEIPALLCFALFFLPHLIVNGWMISR
jgi:hypothetical protein